MSQEVWKDFTKEWSDAHEYWSEWPNIEKIMDLHNNSVWLSLSNEKSFILKKISIEYTRKVIRNWRWLRIVDNKFYFINWNDDL